jgi:hypothetical protein
VAGDRPVKIHPIVGRMIDPEVLAKLRGAVQASSAPTRRADAE